MEGGLEQRALWNIEDLSEWPKSKKIKTYEIINHDEISSDSYIALKNGTYTFKVVDLITGNNYTKAVNVDNIDKSMQSEKQLTIKDHNVGCGDMTITYIEGMTWKDWINSPYNDPEGDFYIGEDCYNNENVSKAHVVNESASWGAPNFDHSQGLANNWITMDEEISPTRWHGIWYAV